MKQSTRTLLIIIAIALLPVVAKLQSLLDPGRKQFQPGKGVSSVMTQVGNNPVVLPSQFVAGTIIGFREVVAGLLWVRVNDFFHSGNYEAIVPLTRIITWLDPHQIDVYCTGAWHLAYNFVDSAQRADHRLLAPAMKFLEEGIENNPGVWDPKFDLGFTMYSMKAHDFDKAVYWIRKASQDKGAPLRLERQIAHNLEKAGKIEECEKQWLICIEHAKAALKKNPKDLYAKDHLILSQQNLERLRVRRALRSDLYKHPLDVQFEATFKKIAPRVFVIRGRANLPDFARISVVLADEDYKEPTLKEFNWQVDPNTTILWDIGLHGIVVQNGKFERKYDLTKDLKQYPFKKERYVLSLTFDPRTAASWVQDVTGWRGEGITDKKYLDTSIPGIRRIQKVFHLKREDIL
jgi:tetratricopeptide (TPR) repeat protein